MSLYVVERERPWFDVEYDGFVNALRGHRFAVVPMTAPVVVDCNARDGEWHAVVTLPHEVVEHEGRAVPLFEGDVERREWEARRRKRVA